MTPKPKTPYAVSEPDVVKLGSEAKRQPAAPAVKRGTREAPASTPSGTGAPSARLPLQDRIGHEIRTLSEIEWRVLHERGGLIELVFGRRQRLIALRLCNGVALAHINAALRTGMRSTVPRAEDNKTVAERRVEGGGIYYDHIHVEAWNPRPRGRR